MIRCYRPDDLDTLKKITADCFEEVSIDRNIETRFGQIGGHDWRWRKLRHIDDDVAGDHAAGVFVYEEEGEIIGYVSSRINHQSKIGQIPNVAVLPAHQGKGIGRRLLQAALDHMRQQGMECAKIETLEQNPIGHFLYPDLGFEEVAHQIHYAMRLE
jgi:ribosomal protein S18 acetylase RimI-like enzyme